MVYVIYKKVMSRAIRRVLKAKTLLPVALMLLFVTAGCARYSCAPQKGYHDSWVANGDSFPTSDTCMTAIWDVGMCSVSTPAVADVQIKWALECVAYCKQSSKEKKIKACTGISMDQDHGRPLCKRLSRSAGMPELDNPWYVICADISATCQCEPLRKQKK